VLTIFLLAYSVVFVAELVGDKTLYTLSALATRFRLWVILCGVAPAFMIKMGAAVLAGGIIADLPRPLVTALSAMAFFSAALFVWLKDSPPSAAEQEKMSHRTGGVIAFVSVVLTEWGDIGQITVATLAANHHAPFAIWSAGVLAMVTKSALAATLGIGLRRLLPRQALRYGAVCLCVLMGCLAAFRVEL